MALFAYRAIDADGRISTGNLDAANAIDLELRLKRLGLDLLTFEGVKRTTAARTRKVNRAELITFCFHLSQLLKAETAEREVRSVAYQLKLARFPAYRDLAGFDFAHSEVNEALVRQLHRCEFMEDAQNVVLVGGPGTGKTHIATALGVQAIEHHHRRVRFFSTVELVNALEQVSPSGT